MKNAFCLWVLLVFLAGCTSSNSEMNRGVSLRERLLAASGCSFTMEVTADFGENTYSFCLDCDADKQGNVKFTVTKPESISGISGIIDASGGKLTFESTVLAFSLLADGEVSPVSAPWLFLKTVRSGYMTAASAEGDLTRLTIDDSYEADALQLDIWLDTSDTPVQAEVIWQGRRVLSMLIRNFVIV